MRTVNRSVLLACLFLLPVALFAQNYAVQLDGATSYGTVPHDPVMNVGTGDFTIEAMVKGASWPIPEPTVFSKGEGSYGSHFFMGVGNTGGNVGTVRFGAQSWTNPFGHVEVHSTYTLSLNEWHHLAGVRQGNTFKIYIDGMFNAEETATIGNLSTEEVIYIGNNRTLTDFFDGCIDEVRFWNDARTDTEIAENAFVQLNGNEANLVGLWRLNEGAGSAFGDATSNSNTGTFTGSFDWVDADWSTGGAFNVYLVDDDTQALWRFNEDPGTFTAQDATTNSHTMALTDGAEFTGTAAFNGSVDCTGPTAVATNYDEIGNSWDALSIDVHFMATVIGDDNTHPLVTRYRWHNAEDPCYLLWLMPDGSLFGEVYLNDPGGEYVFAETIPMMFATDQWYDVRMTWSSGQTLKLFVNGQQYAESAVAYPGTLRVSDDPLEVGAVNYTGYPPEFFTGYIDEVRISDIDRSTQEPPPDDPVTLTLLPSNTTIPPGGGTLNYSVHIVSTLPDRYTNVYYWTDLLLPNGNTYPPGGWLISLHTNLPPYADIYRTGFTQNVPGFAQAGEYQFQGHFGYPGGHFVSDSFAFTKYGGTSTGFEVMDWAADGELGLDEPVAAEPLPVEWAVSEAYPNPFNPSTTVAIALPESSQLTVRVTNVNGREVATLANGTYNAGDHSLTFNAQGLASGLYFIHAHVPGKLNQVQKVMLVR